MRVLLLAPPGAGKGTQGERIAARFGAAHIATGDMLREAVAQGTPIGKAAKALMDRGDLIPDELVVEMMFARIQEPDTANGFVLDGFPRTLAQAEAAYEWARARGLTFHAAVYLDVPEEELQRRLLERAHIEGRDDDTEETIRHRLEVFAAQTKPLFDYYKGRGILVAVDAVGDIDEITDRIMDALVPYERAD